MVTTVTTVAAGATLGISAFISIAAVITLIALLTTKELAATSNARLPERFVKFASIGILPLVIAFGITVIIKILDLL